MTQFVPLLKWGCTFKGAVDKAVEAEAARTHVNQVNVVKRSGYETGLARGYDPRNVNNGNWSRGGYRGYSPRPNYWNATAPIRGNWRSPGQWKNPNRPPNRPMYRSNQANRGHAPRNRVNVMEGNHGYEEEEQVNMAREEFYI